MIGNGKKLSFFARLLITGDNSIANVNLVVNKVNHPNLTFVPTADSLLSFDEDSGIFTFLRQGLFTIMGTLNITTTTGVTKVEITPEYNDGSGWVQRSARNAELPIIGSQQTSIEGTIARINKGDKIRFAVRSPNASAGFKTETIGSGATIPAAVLHMILFVR